MKMNRRKIISLLLLASCVIGLFLYRNMTAIDANKRLSQEITEKIEKEEKEIPKKSSGNGEEEKEKENNKEAELYKKKLSETQKINEEAVAWLTLPGTFIDYPVTQAENNEYYLDRSILLFLGIKLPTLFFFFFNMICISVFEVYNK